MGQMGSCWTDWEVTPRAITSGDYVIVLIDFAATAVATRRRAGFPIAEVWHMRESKVVSLHPLYSDTLQAALALGVSPSA